ncbi:ABC transporter substrate-binding protein [Variovorax fucosicus]|uniref:ABC transporter substrate-binding protein n=1 Tax=Variovorax fucosicus TaxID=3053517 RepID=UPI002575A018|nr:ABC transporter substrate-binding protein [Variovorax sp. J22G47]MDM0058479.1 ABC transporter substrate-binding protein [Variovorax sp. J22G47]
MKSFNRSIAILGAGKARAVALVLSTMIAVMSGTCAMAQGSGPEIRVALSAGLDVLDPTRSTNGADFVIYTQVYETLLDLDPKTGELVPKLATSFRLKSPTVWEFKLRRGVKFHDGTPFTSADVKYSIERVLDPATSSPHLAQLASVKEVRAINELTVEIETKTPDPLLPRRMQPVGGAGRVFIVPKMYFEAGTKQEVSDKPVGTGPYKLGEWRKGQSLTLLRNEDYWGKKPDGAKGTFTFITENATRVNALLSGEVDVIQRLPIPDVPRVEGSASAKIIASSAGVVHTLLLDSRKPPFDDLNTRKAFAHALNMNNVIGNLLGKYGRVLPVPLGPTVTQLDKSIAPYKYDRNLAKELLGNKAPLELSTYTSDGRYVADRDIYQAVNAQLSANGFKVKPQTLEWGRFVSLMQSRSAGPFYVVGWDFSEGDASKMNSFLKSSSAFSVTNDPAYDKLVDAAAAEMDEAKRTELWKTAQKLVHEKYYVAAVWQADAIYGFSKKMNFQGTVGEVLDLSKVTVAP